MCVVQYIVYGLEGMNVKKRHYCERVCGRASIEPMQLPIESVHHQHNNHVVLIRVHVEFNANTDRNPVEWRILFVVCKNGKQTRARINCNYRDLSPENWHAQNPSCTRRHKAGEPHPAPFHMNSAHAAFFRHRPNLSHTAKVNRQIPMAAIEHKL